MTMPQNGRIVICGNLEGTVESVKSLRHNLPADVSGSFCAGVVQKSHHEFQFLTDTGNLTVRSRDMPKHSKIQLQVLRLYKNFMRVAAERPGIAQHVRGEFKKNKTIPKKNILMIEYLMRRAERQMAQLSKSSVQGVGVFVKDPENN